MANLQYVLHKRNKNTGSLKFVQPEAMQAVLEFHSGIAGYAQTPLVSLPNLAKQLGVGQIFVKDESARFGLNAFKALGGSYVCNGNGRQSRARRSLGRQTSWA